MRTVIKLLIVLPVFTLLSSRAENAFDTLSAGRVQNEDIDIDGRRRAAFALPNDSYVSIQNVSLRLNEKSQLTSRALRDKQQSSLRHSNSDAISSSHSSQRQFSQTRTTTTTTTTSRPDIRRPTTPPVQNSTNRSTRRKPRLDSVESTNTSATIPIRASYPVTTPLPVRNPNSGYGIQSNPPKSDHISTSGVRPTAVVRNKHSPQPPAERKQNATTACGESITLTSLPHIIRSPGWTEGRKYPPNSDCTWRVTTAFPQAKDAVIKIKIRRLEIEDQVGCPYDFLDIKDHRRLCGFIENKEVSVNSSKLMIIFKSDSNYEDRGFEIELSTEMPGCLSEVRLENRGVITSPQYPNNYPDSLDCWTLLNGEDINGSLILTFEVLNLEPDEQCAYDFLEVYEIDNSSSKAGKSLGKFCDKQVDTSEGKQSSSSASDDYLPDARLGGPNDKPANIIVRTNGPKLLLHFHSDQLLNFKGYKASYMLDTSLQRSSGDSCITFNRKTQTITSPQYPEKYPPNKDCSMELIAPDSDHRIAIIFDAFQMEIDPNCSFDRLEIYDSSNRRNSRESIYEIDARSLQRVTMRPMFEDPFSMEEPSKVLCGRKNSRFKYLSQGPKIRLRFVSDDFSEYSGFSAKYTFIRQSDRVVPTPATNDYSNSYFDVILRNASVVRGSSHLLHCKPRNYQYHENRTINWFLNGKLITDGLNEDATKLLIREFGPTNAGHYICKYGEQTSESWLFSERPKCSLVFHLRPRDIVETEGAFAILECAAVLTPERSNVTISWFKDGKRINGNKPGLEKLKNHYLLFHGVKVEDSGYYFCVAESEQYPNCALNSGAKVTVKARANVEQFCGMPKLGRPSREKPSVDTFGKIVGGKTSEQGAFPWQVMFWDINRKSFCGGALLNERWVATAAHCFAPGRSDHYSPPESQIFVRLGKYDQMDTEEQEVQTKILEVVKHPGFNPDTFDNDLALVHLVDHVTFTDYIKPICLGSSKKMIDDNYFKQGILRMGHVTGWGQLKENGPQPRKLQELRMPIVEFNTCKNSTNFKVTTNMFCAGYAQEIIGDACKGDSGGPFVAPVQDRWYLLGIVSWGEGCGRTGKYGFYTKVSNYIEWIKGVIKE